MASPYLPLVIDNLSLFFSDGGKEKTLRKVLNDISLNLSSEGISVIMGPNGAGKTLLLKCLCGLLTEYIGSIHWQKKIKPPQLAWVPQSPVLLDRSVYENILLPLKRKALTQGSEHGSIEARCQQAIEWAGIKDIAHQHALSLSTGEQQLSALARAWALKPDILLLDEPTANLDPVRYDKMNTLIQTMSTSCKIILSTHNRQQAQLLAEDILLLSEGKLNYYPNGKQYFEA